MITKEQALGMYKHIAKVYYINTGHPEIRYDWNWGDISLTLNLSGFGMGDSFCCEIPIDKCKLILRPFEDMTDEEMDTITNLINTRKNEMLFSRHNKHNYILTNSEVIEYLVSIGIDVFNLKERGWAIYESDLEERSKK